MGQNTEYGGSDRGAIAPQTRAMDEDRQALDALWEDTLAQFPPGEKREFWLACVRKMALVTRCPQWTYTRPRLRLVQAAPPIPKSD